MADVAAAFHWSRAELLEMDFEELCQWHPLAVERLPARGGRGV